MRRALGYLALLAAGFIALVWAYDLAEPPAWRGLAILLTAPVLFRTMNRFEPPRRT